MSTGGVVLILVIGIILFLSYKSIPEHLEAAVTQFSMEFFTMIVPVVILIIVNIVTMVRVFLQYLQRNSVLSTVCWHDSCNVYYKTEYGMSQNGLRTRCYRSRLVCCPGAIFVCQHGRNCDALETGNPGAEYRNTTPLEIRFATRWYPRAKMPLKRHAECSVNIPAGWCSQTAAGGAPLPEQWCMEPAQMVRGLRA